MSGRDDSNLYTGATSASLNPQAATEVRKARVDMKTEKSRQRNDLLPAAEIVTKMIDDEIAEVSNINYLEIEKMLNDEHFKSEMMSRKKYVEKLKDFKTRVSNTLRDNKDSQ